MTLQNKCEYCGAIKPEVLDDVRAATASPAPAEGIRAAGEPVMVVARFWQELGEQQAHYSEPEMVYPDPIFRIKTKETFMFDDYFWQVFQKYPFGICHVTFLTEHLTGEGGSNEQVFDLRFNVRGSSSTAPTDSARLAAEETHKLCDKLAPEIPGDSTSYAPSVEQIAAIIRKHFAAVPVEQAPEALKRASKLCRSVIPGARVELIFQNLQDAQTVHEWLVTLAAAATTDNDAESECERFHFLDSHGEEPFIRESDHKRVIERLKSSKTGFCWVCRSSHRLIASELPSNG